MKTRVSGVPYRVELPEGSNPKQFALGALVGGVAVALIALAIDRASPEQPQLVADIVPADIIKAYNQGIDDALKTNPASWALEQSCLELWANKQPTR